MSDDVIKVIAIAAIGSASQIILSVATLVSTIRGKRLINMRLDGFQSVLMEAKKQEGISEGMRQGVDIGVSKTIDTIKQVTHPHKD
jgi:hypothetical protein